jgi:hypothetical protein
MQRRSIIPGNTLYEQSWPKATERCDVISPSSGYTLGSVSTGGGGGSQIP